MAISLLNANLLGPEDVSPEEGGKRYVVKLDFETEDFELTNGDEIIGEPLDVAESEMLITVKAVEKTGSPLTVVQRNIELRCPKLKSVKVRVVNPAGKVSADQTLNAIDAAGEIADDLDIGSRHIYHPDPSPIRENPQN